VEEWGGGGLVEESNDIGCCAVFENREVCSLAMRRLEYVGIGYIHRGSKVWD